MVESERLFTNIASSSLVGPLFFSPRTVSGASPHRLFIDPGAGEDPGKQGVARALNFREVAALVWSSGPRYDSRSVSRMVRIRLTTAWPAAELARLFSSCVSSTLW